MDTREKLQLDYAIPLPKRPVRVLALVGIAFAAVLAGTLVGIGTNAINGFVSPTYFINVMGWQYVSNVWAASVLQGVFEGTVVGILFSVVLTTTIGIITRATCTFGMGFRWLGWIILTDLGLWFLGGVGGVVLAALLPQVFRDTFIGVPSETRQMLRFAWVGGSIWGAEIGGLAAIVVGLILFWRGWKKMLREETIGLLGHP